MIDVYDRLDDFNLRDEMFFYNFVDVFCEYKYVVEVEEFCFGKSVVGVRNIIKIYNLIFCGWFKLGWWGKCKEYWEKMDY